MDRIYEDEDNNHGLDNSLPMVHTPPALLGENNSIMVHTPPAKVNIEGSSNNYLNSPNNGNENDLKSESGLTSHLSLGIVSSVTRSSPSNNICPSSSKISAGYANPKDILNILIYVKTNYLSVTSIFRRFYKRSKSKICFRM